VTNILCAVLELNSPEGPLVSLAPQVEVVDILSSDDGVTDYAGTSGATHLGVTSDLSTGSSVILQGDPRLAAFIAAGSTPENIILPALATGASYAVGPGNLEGKVFTFAKAIATVVYEYESVNKQQTLVALGDTVWWDYNANGIQEANEPGIPGATVILKDSVGNELKRMTTTSPDGQYIFDKLTPGTYLVEVILPANVPATTVQTYDLDDQLVLNKPAGTPSASWVTLGQTSRLDVDFGYLVPVSCQVAADATAICEGSAATFAVEVSGGSPPYTYVWVGPDGSTSTDAMILATASGTYTVTVQDSIGMTTQCSATLTVYPVPDATLEMPFPLPVGSSSGNLLSAPAGAASYTWTLLDGAQSGWAITAGQGTSTITYKAGTPGSSATFEVLAVSDHGCQSLGTISFRSLTGATGCTPGFWGNKNGQALETDESFAILSELCLVNEDGSDRDFLGTLDQNRAAISAWLGANARNMAYKLSQHLAAFRLNVQMGWYSGTHSTFTNPLGPGTVTANQLIELANQYLCAYPLTTSASPQRSAQEAIKNVLDAANNACQR
jgi:hypothetical protein